MSTTKPPVRRRASQARSKATVQRILDAAAELIAEKGGGSITMKEIAQRADVVLGSLYQYFSDKSSIHKAILLRYNADVRIMLYHYIDSAQDLASLIDAVCAAFHEYYTQHQQDPFVNGIWAIVQTDAELQKIDIEDTLQNARYLQSAAVRFLPAADKERLFATCALLIQFATTASLVGRAIPDQLSKEVPSIFANMIQQVLASFSQETISAAAVPAPQPKRMHTARKVP